MIARSIDVALERNTGKPVVSYPQYAASGVIEEPQAVITPPIANTERTGGEAEFQLDLGEAKVFMNQRKQQLEYRLFGAKVDCRIGSAE